MSALVLEQVCPLGADPQDLAMADGRLIGASEVPSDAQRVDCTGLVALPGLVDLHTHLREPGRPDAETVDSGSRAAARGGFTAIFAMANTDPVTDHPSAVERVLALATRSGHCDVYPVGAVTLGLDGQHLADIAGMAQASPRVRMFSDDGKCVEDSALMRDALAATRDAGCLLAQHAQDSKLTKDAQLNDGVVAADLHLLGWPAMGEESIIARDVVMAHHLGARLHVCHVSTAGSVEVIRWAKSQGFPVTAEVTPHHLSLTHELARTGNANFKVNPPLRTAEDVEAVRAGLVDGTIDVVATDHAPHPLHDKRRTWSDAPMGMRGLETALALVAEVFIPSGVLTWKDVAERMSVRPARMLGLEGTHGTDLGPGSPATLCLVDPSRPWIVNPQQLASLSGNTPFAGHRFQAQVVATILRGRVTHDVLGLGRPTG